MTIRFISKSMKIFTVEEANTLLPEVAQKLVSLQKHYLEIGRLKTAVREAATGAQLGGGGMPQGSHYVKSLIEVGKLTIEINDLGVQIKDYTRGLIDFPTMRDGRLVLLCWQIGEPEKLEWWHDMEAGFSGRERL